ncbi:asparagine synthase (glutamine-hydrolyzing) [Thiococcus pfennigii]|uniref:asparagine synthase (glutamine-hydrolyzing) n=1 Tax=Thiococcus pfennigii TaxID=1057 RepID=UPI001906013F|nr:asparagine synthase (glutamine-hydrolyzing) [Thiococcus pfennigii]MBK1701764.1 asparagine synthase (glutamine-hydrolyzing) [Thiococcus pfennigii]MBK1733565.1 asparagine synthase (glutamine-hydrolyzing) [Thiococcus pfennigii]
MCGITGFVDFAGLDSDEARSRLKRMTDAIIHRGPDEEGAYVDSFAALGHRRLSIIDLSSGQQPMGAAGGQVQIVFNGEIYNFLDIRRHLEARGYDFRTHSDTEVILAGYMEWGEQCVEKLNGMFAFAIWDARNRRLFIARDRVGKKPLYYWRKGSLFAFASELKALRAGGLCPDGIDAEALDCYLTFGYIPAPRTIHTGVRKLQAARSLMVTESAEVQRQYWHLSFANPRERVLADAAEELDHLLHDAVKCRLMSEVPLGAFLSGGLDSSLVVSSMARSMDRRVVTNAIGFHERRFNELPAARAVASHLCTEHHEFVVEPQAASVLERIVHHLDEPFADSSAIPTWYVCEMARKNVTVALSGDGGDENFGGYTFRYLPHIAESRLRGILPTALRRLTLGPLGALWPGSAKLPRPLRLKTIFENLAVGDAEAFYRDLIWLRADTRAAVYSADFRAALRGYTPFEEIQPLYAGCDALDALGRAQFTDIHFYMTEDVLVKVDRISMAHALEVRSPLMDHRVIEFAAGLPRQVKVGAGRGKLVMRQLAAQRLPREIVEQKKSGFSIPAAQWLRGQLKGMAHDSIFTGRIYDYLERNALRRLWDEHQAGSRDHSVFLWAVMMLGLWQRRTERGPV